MTKRFLLEELASLAGVNVRQVQSWEAQGYREHHPWRAHLHHLERPDLEALFSAHPRFRVEAVAAGLTPEGEDLDHAEIERVSGMLLATNDAKALAAAARGFRQLAVTEKELRANRVPTLSIIGELDPLKEDVDRMVGVMEKLTLKVVEGADHQSAGVSPEFLGAIMPFLEQNSVDAQRELEPAGR